MIKIEDLSFYYDKNSPAITDLNLEIKDHEWISILGHNGSGKSTLSKLLVGLLEPQKGAIYYDEEKLNPNDMKSLENVRKKVGIVFQNPDNQFVGVNVKYDIAFGLENKLLDRDTMNDLISKWTKAVNMEDYLEREPNTLSGGQKQRVAIAGILALNCDIIILDEATSMLDPDGVVEITKLICDLKNVYNKTIITITHDLNLAKLSDRVVVLKNGKIIADDLPEVVFKEKEILQSSNLDMPFDLRMYDKVTNDEILKNNKKLGDVLWEYHLKK